MKPLAELEEEVVGTPAWALEDDEAAAIAASAARRAEQQQKQQQRAGRRLPRPKLEKYTLSVALWTAVTLPLVTVFACLVPWGWHRSLWGMLGIAGVLLEAAMVLWALYAAMSANPYASAHWTPPGATEDELREAREQAPAKEANSARDKLLRAADYYDRVSYCTKCQLYKPPRCHHCNICGRCTLAYDHHCGWISTCIGFDNHNCFLLLLLYAVVQCAVDCVALYQTVYEVATAPVVELSARVCLCAFYLLLAAYFTLVLLSMAMDQLKALATSESLVEAALHSRVRHYEPDFVSPYSKGFLANLREVMGPSPRLWLLPLHRKRVGSAGCAFATGSWPPAPVFPGAN